MNRFNPYSDWISEISELNSKKLKKILSNLKTISNHSDTLAVVLEISKKTDEMIKIGLKTKNLEKISNLLDCIKVLIELFEYLTADSVFSIEKIMNLND